MSKFEIKMPKLGESITEGTIVSWSVKVGDMIQEDDVLFEVNTAKVSAEIPSPVAGKVVEILYKEGDTVAVGTVVAIIDLDGEESSGTEPINVSETSPSLAETARNESANTASKPVVVEEERWYSPVVIQLAREAKIPKEELDAIQGTGYEGRLSKKDIKDYIEKKKESVFILFTPTYQFGNVYFYYIGHVRRYFLRHNHVVGNNPADTIHLFYFDSRHCYRSNLRTCLFRRNSN